MIKDVLRWIYWYPFRVFIQMLPFRYSYFLARVFGIFAHVLFINKRKSLEMELLFMFDRIAERKDLKGVVRNAFINFFQNEMDVVLFPRLNEKNICHLVSCSGLEHLDNALAEGKGAMLLFAHFGANKVIMPAIGYRGYKMSQLSAQTTVWAKKMPNKKFSYIRRMGLEIRWKYEKSLPVTHINIFGSMKKAFLCLKRNEVLGIAMDGGGGKDRIAVDFLGKKALFSTGAMEIAIRTGCAVLPTFIIREKSGRHNMIIEPPLEIRDQRLYSSAIRENISAFVKRLEKYALKYPCHYLNFLALRRYMEGEDGIPFFIDEERIHAESIAN